MPLSHLVIRCQRFFGNFFDANQCDQMMELKVAQFPPKIALKVATHFLFNSDIIRNSPKMTKIFGLLLWDNLLPWTCNNRPIWSHWCQLKTFQELKTTFQLPKSHFRLPQILFSGPELTNHILNALYKVVLSPRETESSFFWT